MGFWIRKIILLSIVAIGAYLLLSKSEMIFKGETVNTAARGFSEFYSKIRGNQAGSNEQSDYHITLPDTSGQLSRNLAQRGREVMPAAANWQGLVTDRRFRAGDSLKNTLSQYARSEGVELYWTLPRDYVVKQYFQTDTTLLGTVQSIGKAIAPDFAEPVLTYFCPNERAAVITDRLTPYLQQHCQPIISG
ncbi:toxin co-regulated pilus biosynthesis Q family protein [Rheinheimera sp. SM2107]|uniref:Toxin co-regulated pilus biosynthesis Q family protein n=2 Tax=Arsukibacterium indicum TaxID=2848612 RepID=A0ABS6MJH6_9GAMM|nr:toxin co-regulated pilus biosynthesis Q family protein [Arsukibacterium indicum]